jgi:hypothetical protein
MRVGCGSSTTSMGMSSLGLWFVGSCATKTDDDATKVLVVDLFSVISLQALSYLVLTSQNYRLQEAWIKDLHTEAVCWDDR